MKIIALGGVALAAIALLGAAYSSWIANPRVIAELRISPDGDRARRAMLLTLPSGRSLPVNYLREGNAVYAGADFPWWRELRGEGGRVELLVRGETLRGHGRAIEDDAARTDDVFSRLRPTVPSWLPRWLNATLVVIELDETEPGGEAR